MIIRLLITNDVDEAFCSRIDHPFERGPNATLGPSINIDIPRPRDRKAINHVPRYKSVRREVIDYLLGSGARKHTTVTETSASRD